MVVVVVVVVEVASLVIFCFSIAASYMAIRSTGNCSGLFVVDVFDVVTSVVEGSVVVDLIRRSSIIWSKLNKLEDGVTAEVLVGDVDVVVVEVLVVEVVVLVKVVNGKPLFWFHCCMIFEIILCLSELKCSSANWKYGDTLFCSVNKWPIDKNG